jgi:hypothetical protein
VRAERVVGIAAIATAVVAAISLRPFPLTAVDRLNARPESNIVYPGSTLLRRGGAESRGPNDYPEIWQQFGTTATAEEVVRFYDAELRSRGFGPARSGTRLFGMHEDLVCTWQGSEVLVRVGVYDPERFQRDYPSDRAWPTVYELAVLEYVSELGTRACPRQYGI